METQSRRVAKYDASLADKLFSSACTFGTKWFLSSSPMVNEERRSGLEAEVCCVRRALRPRGNRNQEM